MNDQLSYRKAAGWILILLFPVLSLLYLFGTDNTPYFGTVSNFLIKQNNTSIIGACFLGFYVFIAICYKGVNLADTVIMKISGLSGFGTIFFETTRSIWVNKPGGIGVLNLAKPVSLKLHVVSGGIFYVSLILITAYSFTRKSKSPSDKELSRIKVFKICSVMQIIFFICQFICMYFSLKGINNLLLQISTSLANFLFLFTAGFAWIVKGGGIKKLND